MEKPASPLLRAPSKFVPLDEIRLYLTTILLTSRKPLIHRMYTLCEVIDSLPASPAGNEFTPFHYLTTPNLDCHLPVRWASTFTHLVGLATPSGRSHSPFSIGYIDR
ncbi:hypothetical protein [Thiobacillus sp.]|uniref:hypothetical protein n=1 Tax=Thiobacillus sp. TaxID=924 RepID=UPI0011D7FD91|nr:hypothetical protein [Thiobacillus sp.]TXH76795.1 MAG: hypothetical protein E6Q82_01540 [Thiobacillus sp.]